VKDYEVRWPKATEKMTKARDALDTFLDFPTEHWIHLKTTNPLRVHICHRAASDQSAQGPGLRAAGLALAYMMIEQAQTRWRMVNAPHLVALVCAGVVVKKGAMVERDGEQEEEVAA
jgi:putative transposase